MVLGYTAPTMVQALFELCLESVCEHFDAIDFTNAPVSPLVFDQIIARLSEVGQLSDSTLGVIIVGGRLASIALPDAPVAVTAKLFLNVLKQGVLCNLEELDLSNARHAERNTPR